MHFIISAPEASWRRDFDPCTPLLFYLYHYLEQNGYFWWVPEHVPGPSSQVLPGYRVRRLCYPKKIFVRIEGSFWVYIHSFSHSTTNTCRKIRSFMKIHVDIHFSVYRGLFLSVHWVFFRFRSECLSEEHSRHIVYVSTFPHENICRGTF